MGVSSSFAIQLLAKIGAPLAAAIEAGPVNGNDAQAAETMAKMLGLAVEISITLHGKLDVTENEKQADDTRTALAAIAAELISEFYIVNQKLPEDNDKNRMIKSLESVLGFADKFSSAQDQASRLVTLGRGEILFDSLQSQLVVLQAIGGVVNAVIEFPFGQNENKLIQDIAERLQKDSFALAKENGTSDKLSELLIFKSLADLYAQCHRAETRKISSNGGDGTPSLDPVWAGYEMRVAMMGALVSGGDDITPEVNDAPKAEAPAATPTPTPASTPAAPAAVAPTGGPMGFFAKKPAEDTVPAETKAEASTPPPPLTPPPKEAPASIENPLDMSEDETVPKDNTPAQPEKAVDEKPTSPSGGPMSFFKAPPKKEEDED